MRLTDWAVVIFLGILALSVVVSWIGGLVNHYRSKTQERTNVQMSLGNLHQRVAMMEQQNKLHLIGHPTNDPEG